MSDAQPNDTAHEHSWSRLNDRRWCTGCGADGGAWPTPNDSARCDCCARQILTDEMVERAMWALIGPHGGHQSPEVVEGWRRATRRALAAAFSTEHGGER